MIPINKKKFEFQNKNRGPLDLHVRIQEKSSRGIIFRAPASMAFRKVVVGVSGGVDSAVSALLLKKKGFNVCGVFMKNWDEIDENGQCMGERDWSDAKYVCEKLQIPITQVNFVKDYWNDVFWKFLEDYQSGQTPNPDILCNRHIKFDHFYNYAKSHLKADAIATGHYAQTSFGEFLEKYEPNKDARLLQAVDVFKDQTFFLSGINQRALRHTMFPLGSLLKTQVKEIATKAGLNRIAVKKESTGICFIGERNFKNFISEYIESKPGDFIDIDTGKVVGHHDGIHQWTLGQRCRISGCLKPYFIARKDVNTNEILVAAGTDHPALFTNILITQKPSWIRRAPVEEGESFRCEFRFQHTKPLVKCTVKVNLNGLKIELDENLRALTPGQYAVFYLAKECLGCARISSTEDCKFSNSENVQKESILKTS